MVKQIIVYYCPKLPFIHTFDLGKNSPHRNLISGRDCPRLAFLPRKARKGVSPDAETITKRDLRANQSYLRHFPSGRKVIGETRRENFVNHFPDQKLSVFSVVNILIRVEEDCSRLAEQISAYSFPKLPFI